MKATAVVFVGRSDWRFLLAYIAHSSTVKMAERSPKRQRSAGLHDIDYHNAATAICELIV
jgi:hypothetical protein